MHLGLEVGRRKSCESGGGTHGTLKPRGLEK